MCRTWFFWPAFSAGQKTAAERSPEQPGGEWLNENNRNEPLDRRPTQKFRQFFKINKPKYALLAACFAAVAVNAQTTTAADSLERPFQVTLITPIGTNGLDAYKITNKLSLNIFAGVAGGLNGIELGSFVNVIMKNAKGLQAAGFVNAVLGEVKGGQFAGFVNYCGDTLNGGQFAGFVNASMSDVSGGQFAGFVNSSLGNFKGGQLAGFVNYNQKDFKGLQGAGYVNVNLGDFEGAQLSGFANFNGGDLHGAQLSAFFNRARKVKGLQLGLINIADSVDGASIGLLSFVKNGLHQVEISADELFYTNVTLRLGSQRFYNLFSAGGTPQNKTLLWSIGYGAGTSLDITDRLRTDISFTAHHVSKGLLYHATSELYRIYWGLEFRVAKKCYIAGGPTFNLYRGDTLMPDFTKSYSGIAPYTVLNETNSYGFNYKGWVGFKLAIRFL